MRSIGGKNVKVQSPKRDSFEIGPELASFKIADGLRHELGIQSGVFFVNLPAADLVAETGNFVKTVEAVQFVDTCLGGVLERIYETNGIAVVTSSHGNCEEMSTARSGRAYPSTSMNGVPFHVIDPAAETVELMADGSLEDVAPDSAWYSERRKTASDDRPRPSSTEMIKISIERPFREIERSKIRRTTATAAA